MKILSFAAPLIATCDRQAGLELWHEILIGFADRLVNLTKGALMLNCYKALLVLLSLVSFVGCVSASKHNETVATMQSEIDREKTELEKSKTENQNLTAAVGDLQQKLATTAKDKGQLQSTVEDLKRAIDEMRVRQTEQKKRLEEFKDLTNRFKTLADAGTISVKMVDGKMVVSLGSDVLFTSGSAKLSPAGLATIKEVSQQLTLIPGKRFQIEGHTDNIPIASAAFPSNWELASARSLNVLRAMLDVGMPADRASAASYGDTKPIQSNETPEGRAANRRIAIVVVPDLSSLPGYEELNKMGQ